MSDLKIQLHQHCLGYVNDRIDNARNAIAMAQAAANDETKSSAGDKYETGRAMMQLEIEKHSAQLAEALKLKKVLDDINPQREHAAVQLGSLVITNLGKFYVSISAGQITLIGESYFAISQVSPIGAKMIGLNPGNEFTFNGKNYRIESIK